MPPSLSDPPAFAVYSLMAAPPPSPPTGGPAPTPRRPRVEQWVLAAALAMLVGPDDSDDEGPAPAEVRPVGPRGQA
jgi:hypothetical protein